MTIDMSTGQSEAKFITIFDLQALRVAISRAMTPFDTTDLVVLSLLLLASIAYLTKRAYFSNFGDSKSNNELTESSRKSNRDRDIVQKMVSSGKNCVVFYGSQTGTAEDYASRLAKEGKGRFGLETMVADLEDYSFEKLDTFPEDSIAMFIVATYGEGEPTDNATEFYQFITGQPTESFSLCRDPALDNLNFVAFGLGNNTYEFYNSMVRNVTAALEKLGAHKVCEVGLGDDGAGTMEEDFLTWKENMWTAVAKKMGLEERDSVYEPVFGITESEELTKDSLVVFLGEPNQKHLTYPAKGPFNAQNPFVAPVIVSRELLSVSDRNCLHVELDLSDSNLSYQTGDHVAIWPNNPGRDVDQFLKIIGLHSKRNSVIRIKALEQTSKVPFPNPTTYDAIARYYMEINAVVSRQFIANLAPFAPTEEAKHEMVKLGEDKDYFQSKISSKLLNIAQVLEDVSGGKEWQTIPFSIFIESMNKLQPRYYSISSSSLVNKKRLSITAIVESTEIPGRKTPLKGVATNYLLALKLKHNGDPEQDPHGLSYQLNGPRNSYDGIQVPIYIRHSNFKLPSNPSKPIIMVGPGTGVAPFRGFLQERAAQAKSGIDVGPSILFFGCRNQKDDFIYKDEWDDLKEVLGDRFSLITAFSRESNHKIYVQHRILEHASKINDLLLMKAHFYVCGDAANMAKAVLSALQKVISDERGISVEKADEIIKSMRDANQFQEDIWS
ncbi:NADPH--cytochrome P450 reductase [Golovinomyces cichoracearum]|uniref:NADPH--cytochrome P450 reductase n=1 Tax=Golovinomyces cichoracearum TaxID=62708 RepID=A0A420HAL9_9PEZI|nr:NADPH--cytochrome P450 reductase [Golovinomyces cichoracearum]